MTKRIIISGGGTGGHIYPAIAIANALKEIDQKTEILFVGAEGKMEMEKVPKAGYDIVGLPVIGLSRKVSFQLLTFPFKLVQSLMKARSILKHFKPDVAVGVGGFASGPLLMMAGLQKIPYLLQEQNSYAGITNKLLARKAKKICVAYPDMHMFFPQHKLQITGNPVRKDILDTDQKKQDSLQYFGLSENIKTLFVMGGSLGARSINEALLKSLPRLIKNGYQILWQTGKDYYPKALEAVANLPQERIKVYDFIYRMDLAYAVTDVVVSRAGALSVSELCLVKKPAILIPYPFAAEDHQTKNAQALVDNNAAILLPDNKVSEQFAEEVIGLFENPEKQSELSSQIAKLARPSAAIEIAHEIIKVATR